MIERLVQPLSGVRTDLQTGVSYIRGATPPAKQASAAPGGGDDPPPGGVGAAERKLAAKRHNEGVKVFATWMNTLSGVTVGAAAIVPAVKGMEAFVSDYRPVWFLFGVALHFVGQAALRLEMRSEE